MIEVYARHDGHPDLIASSSTGMSDDDHHALVRGEDGHPDLIASSSTGMSDDDHHALVRGEARRAGGTEGKAGRIRP